MKVSTYTVNQSTESTGVCSVRERLRDVTERLPTLHNRSVGNPSVMSRIRSPTEHTPDVLPYDNFHYFEMYMHDTLKKVK